jgi:hypothetical protein
MLDELVWYLAVGVTLFVVIFMLVQWLLGPVLA